MKLKRLILVVFFAFSFVISQNEEGLKKPHKISLDKYKAKLIELIKAKKQNKFNKQDLINAFLSKYSMKKRTEFDDGRIIEVVDVYADGTPKIYITDNVSAASSISTNHIQVGGRSNLNLTGEAVIVGEWDGGAVHATHQEFLNRLVQMDGASSVSSHSTHVAGTLMGSGVVGEAQGMAPKSILHAYDWSDDDLEMAEAALNGLTHSNHSYGNIGGWEYNIKSDGKWVWVGSPTVNSQYNYNFGQYDQQAREYDEIAYNAPRYLIVKAAGNRRNTDGPVPGAEHWVIDFILNSDYLSEVERPPNPSYDLLTGSGNSKNILLVAAVEDLASGYRSANDVAMSNFSSYGPTDDGRIKPDISANGTGLLSAYSGSSSDYASISGTSMATPSVAGSISLLHELYWQMHSDTLLASTMKALLLHTADEAGSNDGPDYEFGWGLMNSERAAMTIKEDTIQDLISEHELMNGDTLNFNLTHNEDGELKVTIAWTDVPGVIAANSYNIRTARLVNDLDLRVVNIGSGEEYFPWKLNPESPASAATQADNAVDNVEQIFIANAVAGNYKISISHKNSLENGSQIFSMLKTTNKDVKSSVYSLFTYAPTYNDEADFEFYWPIPYLNDSQIGRFGFTNRYIIPETATLDALEFNVHSTGVLGTGKLRYAVYTNNNNIPHTVIKEDTIDFSKVNSGWMNIDVTDWNLVLNEDDTIHIEYELIVPVVDRDVNSIPFIFDKGNGEQNTTLVKTTSSTYSDMTAFLSPTTGGKPGVWNRIILNKDLELISESTNLTYNVIQDVIFDKKFNLLLSFDRKPTSIDVMLNQNSTSTRLNSSKLSNLINAYKVPILLNNLDEATISIEAIELYNTMENKYNIALIVIENKNANEEFNFKNLNIKIPFKEIDNGQVLFSSDDNNSIKIFSDENNFKENINFDFTDGYRYNVYLDEIKKENLITVNSNGFSAGQTGTYFFEKVLSDIEEIKPSSPFLSQNYPNPFNPTTTIKYYLTKNSLVKISIFNIKGQHIKTLVSDIKNEGWHNVTWNGINDKGTKVSSGIYYYSIRTSDHFSYKKMIMIK